MISEMEKLQQIKTNLSQLQVHSPDLYLKLEYIASLTRQLSIHYKYLGLLMFSEDAYVIEENRPTLIRDSVLSCCSFSISLIIYLQPPMPMA